MGELNGERVAHSMDARMDAARPDRVSITFLLTEVTYLWQFFHEPKDGPTWPY